MMITIWQVVDLGQDVGAENDRMRPDSSWISLRPMICLGSGRR
jgi:hypothetical protein